MKGNRGADEEFLSVVRENDLVLLNTWSGASPNVCHTFYNGTVCSQIDFLAVRRPAADATARQSKPHVFDLQGPKHHAVLGSIPWCAGWKLKRPVSEQRGFSLRCMRASLKCMDARALALRGHMLCVLRDAESSCTLAQVNHHILTHCAQLYPTRSCARTNKPSSQQIVTDAIERMWAAQTSIRTAPPAPEEFGMLFVPYGERRSSRKPAVHFVKLVVRLDGIGLRRVSQRPSMRQLGMT